MLKKTSIGGKISTGIISLFLLLLVGSCKKDEQTAEPQTETLIETGTLKIQFTHKVDSLPLNFATKYVNPHGDTFMVSKFNYYISNIVLIKNDNSTFSEPESYHLIQASTAASALLTLKNIPIASYKTIRFMMGVDSARNRSGAQGGDLDPAKGMFWNWNTGYIMLKLEGTSPTATVSGFNIEYHMGGFGGVNKVQRNYEFGFGSVLANVSAAGTPTLFISANINEMFKSPNLIDFSLKPIINSAGSEAKLIADNYADMFTFEKLSN